MKSHTDQGKRLTEVSSLNRYLFYRRDVHKGGELFPIDKVTENPPPQPKIRTKIRGHVKTSFRKFIFFTALQSLHHEFHSLGTK